MVSDLSQTIIWNLIGFKLLIKLGGVSAYSEGRWLLLYYGLLDMSWQLFNCLFDILQSLVNTCGLTSD